MCSTKLNSVISLIFKKVTKTVSLLIILKKRLFPWLMQSNKPFLRLQRQISNPSRPVPGPQVQYIVGNRTQESNFLLSGTISRDFRASFYNQIRIIFSFFQLYFILYIFSLTRMVFLLKYILHPELSGNWIVFR